MKVERGEGRMRTAVEVIGEHGEVWVECDESSVGVSGDRRRVGVSIGHMVEALAKEGYVVAKAT